ncbi:MAG TPA: hypothetical protein VM695_09960 [Phycisphaerae bacterium]|nr:hypothetical protein [Phycisphaerae bacterium]
MADDPTRSATEAGQSDGSDTLDWTKPLPDPKMEKMRQDMVRQHNAKLQEAAQAREDLEAERQTLQQEVEDKVLTELQERGAFDTLVDDTPGTKTRGGEGKGEELTEAQQLHKELADVKAEHGSLKKALQDLTVQREMDRLKGEIIRGMARHPEIFPTEDTEDENESTFLADCIEEIATTYATSGDAQKRAPVAKAVKKVADRIVYIRTRGKTVKKDATGGEGGSRRVRPEGEGGGSSMPDDLKDMDLGDDRFVERIIQHTRAQED